VSKKSGPVTAVISAGRAHHPVVTVSYVPRIVCGALAALITASTMVEKDVRLLVGVLVVGVVWPQLFHAVAMLARDSKRAGFRNLIGDALIVGGLAGLTGFSPLPAATIVIAVLAFELMMGGMPLFVKGTVAVAAGAALSWPLMGFEPEFVPTLLTTNLCLTFMAGAMWTSSYFVNQNTRDLVATRRELRAINDKVLERTELLGRAVAETGAINEVARLVNSTLDVDQVLGAVMSTLQRVFRFDLMGTLLLDRDNERLVVDRYLGPDLDDESATGLGGLEVPLSAADSIFVRAVEAHAPVCLPEIGEERIAAMAPADREIYRLRPVKALLLCPLEIQGEVVGLLYFGSTSSKFDLAGRDISAIERYVVHVATAVRNARLFEESREARAIAEEANATKSQFLANMSHELRTPMNAIIGYSEMLEEEAVDMELEDFVPDLQKIRAAGKHLLGLINGVLDLSKIEAGRMDLYLEPVDVDALLDEVVATVQPLIKKNDNELELVKPNALGEAMLDVTKVRQSMFNLLSNAAKFTEQGRITVEASRTADGAGEGLRFRVADTGIGMSEEQLAKLFQPFTQADASTTRKFGGTGLGLAITRRFAELMGGSVEVSSREGEGTEFTLTLPVRKASPEPDADHVVPQPASRVDGAGPTVLVIDDDPDMGELMRRMLERRGYRIAVAQDGGDGLEMARTLRPVAITLDVVMPRMDGWAVLRALKEDPELADIPVILLSMAGDRRLGSALGATEHLSKPVDQDRLLEILARVGGARSGGRLLFVEDDPDARRLVGEALERRGWTVTGADDGAQGLDRLEETRPDAILLDLMMPGVDGFEFVHELRARPKWRSVPVVVLTAKDLTAEDLARLNGDVECVLQKGATSPAQVAEQVLEMVAAAAGGGEEAMGTRILLVEDNEMNRDMLSRRLQRRGFEVLLAADGAEGIDKARSERPDLILMDMSLPVKDGYEASRELKDDPATSAIPIIALTAHAMVGDREKCLAAGCDDYDSKPVDLPRLLSKIETRLSG